MKALISLLLFCLFVTVSPASAEDVFDGTKPLLCSSIEALDCDPGVECDRGIPEIMGAPQFLRIDFAKKEITGPKRTTSIQMMKKDDDQLILQGYEIGMGWTLAIDRGTGNMRISFAGGESSFIIFGACTTNP